MQGVAKSIQKGCKTMPGGGLGRAWGVLWTMLMRGSKKETLETRFWRIFSNPIGGLFGSCSCLGGSKSRKLTNFGGVCCGVAFLNTFWCYFGWVLEVKNLDFAWEGSQKSRFRLSRFFDPFRDHFGPHLGPKMDPKLHLDASWRRYVAILAPKRGS